MSSAPVPSARPPEAAPSSSRRPALATTSTSYTVIRPKPSPSDARPTASSSNSRIAVYVDGGPSDDPQAEVEPSPWPELGTRKSRIKENIPEVKKMAGTIIRQPGRAQRIASGPATPMFVPYRDPPPGDESMPPPSDPLPRTIGKTPQTRETGSRIPVAVQSTPSFTPFRDEVRVLALYPPDIFS